jgi:hypothetical protein
MWMVRNSSGTVGFLYASDLQVRSGTATQGCELRGQPTAHPLAMVVGLGFPSMAAV